MFLTGFLKLGTLEEFRERMSSSEYELWKEKYWESPFGDERHQLAVLASAIVNLWKDEKVPDLVPENFLPKRPEVKSNAAQPLAEQKAMASAIVAALGGSGGS